MSADFYSMFIIQQAFSMSFNFECLLDRHLMFNPSTSSSQLASTYRRNWRARKLLRVHYCLTAACSSDESSDKSEKPFPSTLYHFHYIVSLYTLSPQYRSSSLTPFNTSLVQSHVSQPLVSSSRNEHCISRIQWPAHNPLVHIQTITPLIWHEICHEREPLPIHCWTMI